MADAEYASSPPNSKPQELRKWWKIFNKSSGNSTSKDKHTSDAQTGGRVFGVSLQTSLTYASVAISQVGPDGKARIYGHVPVVVAKTGLYLKENGVDTPGVFRVSGSNKRIKELETIFDGPPSYGKELTWEAFSVHDAASVFRRYLNMLPEPVIPYDLYTTFHNALRGFLLHRALITSLSYARTKLCRQLEAQVINAQSRRQANKAIEAFRALINSLPPASQHIFFYVLDLLGVFARRSEVNLMPASNLATIFQPGLIRHPPSTAHAQSRSSASEQSTGHSSVPQHDDAVKAAIEADSREHKRSQELLQFLIENQSSFELELPAHLKKKTGNTPKRKPAPIATSPPSSTATQAQQRGAASSTKKSATPHAKKNQDSDEENDYILAHTRAIGLSRRGSDKSEDRRRLRRKKQAETKRFESTQEQQLNAVGIKRNRTLPSSKEGRSGRRTTDSPISATPAVSQQRSVTSPAASAASPKLSGKPQVTAAA